MATFRKIKLKTGAIRFRAEVCLAGFPRCSGRFESMASARQWASKKETEMREGRYRLVDSADHHTLGEMIDRYLELVLPTKSTRTRFINLQRAQLNWWKERLGDFTLRNVTQSILAARRDELALTRKASTVNRYLAALGHVFSIAVKEWEWLEASPMTKLRKPKEGRGRMRFLSDAERASLLEHCSKEQRKPLFLIVVLAISTGARKGELLGVKWRDVDFSRQVITLQHTKNNEQRALFIWGLALELLQQWHARRHPRSEFVFSNRGGTAPMDIEREFRRAVKGAELDDFHFHDLRHTAASYLAMNNASASEIAEILGHKTLNMVKRYAHLTKAHSAQVVAAMNQKIFPVTTQPRESKDEQHHA